MPRPAAIAAQGRERWDNGTPGRRHAPMSRTREALLMTTRGWGRKNVSTATGGDASKSNVAARPKQIKNYKQRAWHMRRRGRGPTPRSAPPRRANENKTHGGRGRPHRRAQRPRRRTIDPTASERMGKTNESGAHSPRRIMRQSIAGETAAISLFLGFGIIFCVSGSSTCFFFLSSLLVFLLFVFVLVFVSFSLSF